MATQQYELKAAFRFPLSAEESAIFLEHAKKCQSILVDLSEASFRAGGLKNCVDWLMQMQFISQGAIEKIIFSFDSLVADKSNLDRVNFFMDTFLQQNIAFSFVHLELIADEEKLKAEQPQMWDLYQKINTLVQAKNTVMDKDANFIPQAKGLFHELEQMLSKSPS